MVDLIHELKAETARLHERLDQHSRMTRLMSADLTRVEYISLLGRLYGLYRPFEALIAAKIEESALRDVLDTPQRCGKTSALRGDLRALDADLSVLPECGIPSVNGDAALIGTLYVLEGASLGGQIIRRHLVQRLGFPPTTTAFFTGYGPETGRMWQAFCALCNDYGRSFPEGRAGAVHAAQHTFLTFIQWVGA